MTTDNTPSHFTIDHARSDTTTLYIAVGSTAEISIHKDDEAITVDIFAAGNDEPAATASAFISELTDQ